MEDLESSDITQILSHKWIIKLVNQKIFLKSTSVDLKEICNFKRKLYIMISQI